MKGFRKVKQLLQVAFLTIEDIDSADNDEEILITSAINEYIVKRDSPLYLGQCAGDKGGTSPLLSLASNAKGEQSCTSLVDFGRAASVCLHYAFCK